MLVLLPILLAVPTAVEVGKPQTWRYLRPAGHRFVLECEVTKTRRRDGRTYVSRTERPGERMTLTLRFDVQGRLTMAEAVRKVGKRRRLARLMWRQGQASLEIPGKNREVLTGARRDAILTTAPDWSDIFQMTRRYDRKKGGRQEFAGIWIHPEKPTLRLTFSIKRVGQDTITGRDKKVILDRYAIRLRSGDYLAWADSNGLVYKLMVPGKPATAVVLEGFQDQTGKLGK
jgi:hypothetical protein